MKEFQKSFIYSLSTIILCTNVAFGTDLTFEVDDSMQSCFNEVVEANVPVVFEYQVVSGGNLDIDVAVEGPNGESIYKERHKEYDTVHFQTNISGEYMMCFSNQFSTFTHKVVFMSFVAGEEKPIVPSLETVTGPLTFMEATSGEIHKSLNLILESQTHYRLQEAQGRRFAEDLNERVLWWSLMQTFIILAIGVSQVLILRNFFSDHISNKPYPVRAREPRYARL